MAVNLLKASAAALTLFALCSTAQADDTRTRQIKRAQTSAPVKHQWTGFYAGANIGYGIAGITDSAPLAVTSLMYGVIGGVQIGYNYQINDWVLGVEADIQASNQSQSYSRNLPIIGNLTVGHEVPYFGTARVRLGYAFYCGCVMAYGTIGVAYGSYRPYATALGVTVSETFTNTALAVGAGVEWTVSDRWTAKLEALYLDTGNVGSGITLPVIGVVNPRLRDTITRIGLNYHF